MDYLGQGTQDRLAREAYLSNPYKQAPTATESMTAATLDGADVAGQQYAQKKQEQAAYQTMDTLSRRLAQGLLGAKNVYQQGYDLVANANDNEAQKTAGQLLMDKAAEQANSIRQSAQASGLDLSRFGADATAGQVQQALQEDALLGLKNLFNKRDMTSDEYYDQQYKDLRRQHYTEDKARAEAARRAGRFQAERMGRLANAFQNYGLNESGSMNGDGVRILNMMAGEDEKAAGLLAQMYANPKNDYMASVEEAKQQRAIEAAKAQGDLNFQRQLALTDYRARKQAELSAYRSSLRGGRGGSGGSGDDDEDGGGGRRSRSRSRTEKYDGYDKKVFDGLVEIRTDLEEILGDIEKGLNSKDKSVKAELGATTGDRLEPLQRKINMLGPYLDGEDWAELQEYKDNIESMRNRLIGVDPNNLTGRE